MWQYIAARVASVWFSGSMNLRERFKANVASVLDPRHGKGNFCIGMRLKNGIVGVGNFGLPGTLQFESSLTYDKSREVSQS